MDRRLDNGRSFEAYRKFDKAGGDHSPQVKHISRNVAGRNELVPNSPETRTIKRAEFVELKRAEKAWKTVKELDKYLKPEERETGEVLRSIRAILNKLTPSKFIPLMKKVLKLNINTIERLDGVIDLIFEKTIDEPNFSEAYAMMCRGMVAIKVNDPEGKQVEFRKLLLTKCQREFERDKTDQIHLSEMKEKYEAERNKDLKVQLKAEYELEELKDRRRTLGNIRFIGELFKLKMLTEHVMHSCIMQLFKAHGEDHLESICVLLTTIGKDLDHPRGKMRMDQYFEQIKKITDERKTNSYRVRFMLKDVMDLRKNNWVQLPRAIIKHISPKTINQVHLEAQKERPNSYFDGKKATLGRQQGFVSWREARSTKDEKDQLQMAVAKMQQNNQPNRTPNRSRGTMGSPGSQPQHQPEVGLENVAGKPRPVRFDPTTMKMTKDVKPQLLFVKFEADITDQIKKGLSCDQMFDWVEKNVEAKERSSTSFLRAMTTAVCNHALTGSGTNLTINQEKFVKYSVFMKKYLEGMEDRELQTLYAVQRLNYELDQPPSLLRKFFEVLYDEEIIQEISFLAWKTSEDPKEMEGHGVAVVASNPFFTWLSTADAESD